MSSYRIDPAMSVYALVGSDTNENRMLNRVRMMQIISREIENAVIVDRTPARVFASFQRISSFMPQVKRYQKLAAQAETVYIFAHVDMAPPPIVNVHYVNVPPDTQLAREWFVVAESPHYFTALVTEEIDPAHDPLPVRTFRGYWTFDEELVGIIQSWLSNLVGITPLDYTGRRDYRRHISLMSRAVTRLTEELARRDGG